MPPFDSWKHKCICDRVDCGWGEQVDNPIRAFMCLKARPILSVHFLSRLAEEWCKDVSTLRPHVLVMIDSTRKSMLDLLQSKETAQYCRIGTNRGSVLNHQDLFEKESTNQLANLANPPPAIFHESINDILGRFHCVVP